MLCNRGPDAHSMNANMNSTESIIYSKGDQIFSKATQEVELKIVFGVASGWDHCIAITESNQAWVLGCNHHGQLNLGSNPDNLPEYFNSWRHISLRQKVVQVTAGEAHR